MTKIERSLRTLGLEAGASREEIAQAYKDLVRVWHPDRLTSDSALKHRAEEKLKDITRAYDVLRRVHPEHTNRRAAPPSDRPTAGKRERLVIQIIPTWIWAVTGFGFLVALAARRMRLALGVLLIYGIMFGLNWLLQRKS